MGLKRYIILSALLSILFCTIPPVKIDPEMKMSSNEYYVKTKFGFLKSSVSFGKYLTNNLKIGSTIIDSTNDKFSMKRNISFIQSDTGNLFKSTVKCEEFFQKSYTMIGKHKNENIDLSYFKIDVNNEVHIMFNYQQPPGISSLKDLHTQIIKIRDNFNNFSDSGERTSSSISCKYDTAEVEINFLAFIKKDSCFNGYYLNLNGKKAFAISFLNKPQVWIRNDLDEKTKNILSAITTALWLKNSYPF